MDFDYQYCLEQLNKYWNLYINEILINVYTEQLCAFAKDGNLYYYDE